MVVVVVSEIPPLQASAIEHGALGSAGMLWMSRGPASNAASRARRGRNDGLAIVSAVGLKLFLVAVRDVAVVSG